MVMVQVGKENENNYLCTCETREKVIVINKKLTGSIPASIGECSYLTTLNLRNNDLSGSVIALK